VRPTILVARAIPFAEMFGDIFYHSLNSIPPLDFKRDSQNLRKVWKALPAK
jgi:hypothetical protein